MPDQKLTAKQAMFVKEYLIDLNATQAAIRAGYSENTAQEIGSQNLSKLIIAEAIQEAMDKRSARLDITADNVLQEIAKLGFSNIKNLYDDKGQLIPIHELPAEVSATITEVNTDSVGKEESEIIIKRKYKIADKGQNLERLGKHLKLFTDKIEQTGADGGPQEHKWTVEIIEPKGDD